MTVWGDHAREQGHLERVGQEHEASQHPPALAANHSCHTRSIPTACAHGTCSHARPAYQTHHETKYCTPSWRASACMQPHLGSWTQVLTCQNPPPNIPAVWGGCTGIQGLLIHALPARLFLLAAEADDDIACTGHRQHAMQGQQESKASSVGPSDLPLPKQLPARSEGGFSTQQPPLHAQAPRRCPVSAGR